MACRTTIIAVFALLEDAGMAESKKWEKRGKLAVLSTWCTLLDDIDDGQLLIAAKVYIRQAEKWWPTPGQLIALIPASGPPLLGWAAAWKRAYEGMHDMRRGRLKPPGEAWRLALRDDEHAAAMAALGADWENLCNSNEERLMWARRDFKIEFERHLKTTTASTRWLLAGGPAPLQLEDSEGRTA